MRRHFQTCPDKTDIHQIPARKRGRLVQACDTCRAKKSQCDSEHPCERCSLARTECSYLRMNGSSRADTERLPMVSSTSHLPDESHAGFSHGAAPFLMSYTDPSLEATTDAFAAVGAHAEAFTDFAGTSNGPIASSYNLEGVFESLFTGIFSEIATNSTQTADDLVSPEISPNYMLALQNRAEELICNLHARYKMGSELSKPSQHSFPLDLAKNIFTGPNLSKYVSAYFTYTHPHFPFLHRPTFDALSVPTPLLLAMFLSGSFGCIPQDDAISARQFYAIGEEYIFRHLEQEVIGSDQDESHGVSTIQAALLIVSLQSCFNNPAVRYRLRVKRHPVLVASLRSMALTGGRRTRSTDVVDWNDFVSEEMKIRLVTYVYVLDCMNTVFFNSPPLMTVAEMTGDMPCATALFEASTASEFAEQDAIISRFEAQSQSVKDLVSSLLHEDSHGCKLPDCSPAEPKHLLVAIFALHSVIFVSRTSLLLSSLYQPLLRATDRWKELWDAAHARQGLEQAHFVGFTKYGAELHWLARKLIKFAHEGNTKCRYMLAMPTDSLRDLHELIKLHSNG
ncbi:hypothetical protein K491DRAFT_502298 [Lophiostoma macrostomum CBS 122681]|uniref:Zn(2)-C6 fungal-type domain-containing protein n=1 Tax=Lophiostoma macrostomum CBS 122681 TaxID=1314788 RepID=A0A6A6T4E3_9PLEO|nr:hypothetical protein K491DRAFT_502298 [Lophiostoma macrostomum CBS 122681]